MSDKNKILSSKVKWTFVVVLAVVVCLEFFIERSNKEFGVEVIVFFEVFFGFVSCALIIFVSKFLGLFLKRSEDYYDEKG